MNLSKTDYLAHLYTCRRHGGELYASPAPAICPVCKQPTIMRHPDYYRSRDNASEPESGSADNQS